MTDRLDDTTEPSTSVARFVGLVRDVIRQLVRVDPRADVDDAVRQMKLARDALAPAAALDLAQPENVRRTRNPTSGAANPIAPPMSPVIVEGKIVASVTFNEAYQGPPSVVHGGFVAAVLDEALGRTRHLTDRNVVTGSLHVKYLRPTPVNVDLVVEAWIADVQERKMISRGILRHGDVVTAEAEGVFVFMQRERFMDLVGDARSQGESHE